jgi:hypothetical protein
MAAPRAPALAPPVAIGTRAKTISLRHLGFIATLRNSLSKPDTKLEFLLGEAVLEEKAETSQRTLIAGAQRLGRLTPGVASGLGTN